MQRTIFRFIFYHIRPLRIWIQIMIIANMFVKVKLKWEYDKYFVIKNIISWQGIKSFSTCLNLFLICLRQKRLPFYSTRNSFFKRCHSYSVAWSHLYVCFCPVYDKANHGTIKRTGSVQGNGSTKALPRL